MLFPCRRFNTQYILDNKIQRFDNSLGNVIITNDVRSNLRLLSPHAVLRGFYNLAETHLNNLESKAHSDTQMILKGLTGCYKPNREDWDGSRWPRRVPNDACPLICAFFSISSEHEPGGSTITQAWRMSLATELFSRYSQELKTGVTTFLPAVAAKIDYAIRNDKSLAKNDETVIAEVDRLALHYATRLEELGFGRRNIRELSVSPRIKSTTSYSNDI